MAAVLRASLFSGISRPIFLCSQKFSTTQNVCAGEKWRVSQGQASDGIRYGPLTDKPDWSFADGRLAPETVRRKKRTRSRLDVAQRISALLSEVDEAKGKTENTTNATTKEESKHKN